MDGIYNYVNFVFLSVNQCCHKALFFKNPQEGFVCCFRPSCVPCSWAITRSPEWVAHNKLLHLGQHELNQGRNESADMAAVSGVSSAVENSEPRLFNFTLFYFWTKERRLANWCIQPHILHSVMHLWLNNI